MRSGSLLSFFTAMERRFMSFLRQKRVGLIFPLVVALAGSLSDCAWAGVTGPLSQDPRLGDQEVITDLGVDTVWFNGIEGQGVTVAVIDTGVDLSHEDLRANLIGGRNFLDLAQPPQDSQGHGTMAAGVIGAVRNNGSGIAGIAPRVKIMPLKVAETAGPTEHRLVAEAIRYAVDQGVRIVYLGVGSGSPDRDLEQAVNDAVSQGCLIIAPAGNDAASINRFPAFLPNVVSVAAADRDGVLELSSNMAPATTLLAPGYVITTLPNDRYGAEGPSTSMAAAVTTGVAALALSAEPALTRRQLRQTLISSGALPQEIVLNDVYELRTVNAARAALTYADASRADAAIPYLEVSTLTPLSGQSLEVRFEVVNAGNAAILDSVVTLQQNRAVVFTGSTGPLAVGERRPFNPRVTVSLGGPSVLEFEAAVQLPQDADPSNDTKRGNLSVTSSPVEDVAVVTVDVEQPPPASVGTVPVRVTVENRGNQPAQGVAFLLQAQERELERATLNLAVDERRTLQLPWDISADPQDRTDQLLVASVTVANEGPDRTFDNVAFLAVSMGNFEPAPRIQYADLDRDGDPFEHVTDAPFRLVDRGSDTYLPVLHFFPEVFWNQVRVQSFLVNRYRVQEFAVHDLNAGGQPMVFGVRNTRAGKQTTASFAYLAGGTFDVVDHQGAPLLLRRDLYMHLFAEPRQSTFLDGLHSVVHVPLSSLTQRDNVLLIGTRLDFFDLRVTGDRNVVRTYGGSDFGTLDAIVGGVPPRDLDPQTFRRVLRTQVGGPLPALNAGDRQYDVHFHTMAEYVTEHEGGSYNVPKRHFGGPLQMVAEAAFAVGMLPDRGPDNRITIDDLTHRVFSTDHAVFYSGPMYFGEEALYPTRELIESRLGRPPTGPDYSADEYALYRQVFGITLGEEVALNKLDENATHMLHYRGQHRDQPWHGGGNVAANIRRLLGFVARRAFDFETAGISALDNPVHLNEILSQDPLLSFSYAAHPHQMEASWYLVDPVNAGLRLLDIATLPRHQYRRTQAVTPAQLAADRERIWVGDGEFLFKGMQGWNQRIQNVAFDEDNNRLVLRKALSPFSVGEEVDQWAKAGRQLELAKFIPTVQAKARGYDPDGLTVCGVREWFDRIACNLLFRFQDTAAAPPAGEEGAAAIIRFPRKLYFAGGTDAHGDFNYTEDSLSPTLDSPIYNHLAPSDPLPPQNILDNAYGKLRTYAFAANKTPRHPADRAPEAERRAVEAYADGNTCVTDGPILRFSLDAEGRFDSKGVAWHDRRAEFENNDGRIGGGGLFDGLGTMLVRRNADDIWIRRRFASTDDLGPGGLLAAIKAWQIAPAVPDPTCAGPLQVCGVANPLPSAHGERVLDDGLLGNNYVMRSRFPFQVARPSAFVLTVTSPSRNAGPGGLLGSFAMGRHTAITNPVWAVPVDVAISSDFGGGSPLPPAGNPIEIVFGERQFCGRFRFEISMLNDADTRVAVEILNRNGDSLRATRRILDFKTGTGWSDDRGLATALYQACNDAVWTFPLHFYPPGTDRIATFVLYMENPQDVHGNALNAVATTFSLDVFTGQVSGIDASVRPPRPP